MNKKILLHLAIFFIGYYFNRFFSENALIKEMRLKGFSDQEINYVKQLDFTLKNEPFTNFLLILYKAKLLTPDNFSLLKKLPNKNINEIMRAAYTLLEKGLLTQKEFDFLVQPEHQGIFYQNDQNFLTLNISIVFVLYNLDILEFKILDPIFLLSDQFKRNFMLLLTQLCKKTVTTISVDDIQCLIKYSNIFESAEVSEYIANLPFELNLHISLFRALIDTFKEYDENSTFYIQFNHLIEHNQEYTMLNNFYNIERNTPSQTTHTRSVHNSVSQSAKTLQKYYGENQDIINESRAIIVKEIQACRLDESDFQKKAALRALNNLDSYQEYQDPDSKLSIDQLFSLICCVLCENTKNNSQERSDAIKRLVFSLYDIRREYNQDKAHRDDLKEDAPMCASGAFNKL